MKCHRCGIDTPRLTIAQRYCPQCEREVRALIAADERRRAARTFTARDETWRLAA